MFLDFGQILYFDSSMFKICFFCVVFIQTEGQKHREQEKEKEKRDRETSIDN